jgi:exonuclease VII large subunit
MQLPVSLHNKSGWKKGYYYLTKTEYTMRMLMLLAGLICCTAILTPVQAQELSKDEKKEWKQKAKEYKRNPAALKDLVEERDRYRRESQELASQINELEVEKTNRRSRIAQLERELTRMQNSLAETQSALDQAQNSGPVNPRPSGGMDDDMSGIVFRVQIGAYSELGMPADLNTEGDNMQLEEENGLQKIIVGKFRDIERAEMMRGYMQQIGIPDAWVVAYQDGVRVPVESVVPGYGQ